MVSQCKNYEICFFPKLDYHTKTEERMYKENCLSNGGSCDLANLDGIEFKIEERVAKCFRGFKA